MKDVQNSSSMRVDTILLFSDSKSVIKADLPIPEFNDKFKRCWENRGEKLSNIAVKNDWNFMCI
jgi:hypothetical protein